MDEEQVTFDIENVIEKTLARLRNYMHRGAQNIAMVFERDKKVEIYLHANYSVTKEEKLKIKTSLNFVVDRYKVDGEDEIDLKQLSLPFDEKEAAHGHTGDHQDTEEPVEAPY